MQASGRHRRNAPDEGSTDNGDESEPDPEDVLAEVRQAVRALRRQLADFTQSIEVGEVGEEPAEHRD